MRWRSELGTGVDRALSLLEAELLGGASSQESRFSVVAIEESDELLVTTRVAKDVKDSRTLRRCASPSERTKSRP